MGASVPAAACRAPGVSLEQGPSSFQQDQAPSSARTGGSDESVYLNSWLILLLVILYTQKRRHQS